MNVARFIEMSSALLSVAERVSYLGESLRDSLNPRS